MGQYLDAFYEQREHWKDWKQRDRISNLLNDALQKEEGLSQDEVLHTLIEARGANLDVRPETYRHLASRGTPGWLAEMGHMAARDPKAAGRQEATRWLRYGRADHTVTRADLATVQSLLLDPDEGVRTGATFALQAMTRDNPEETVHFITPWIRKVKWPVRSYALAALLPAWNSAAADTVFQIQFEQLKDPKRRPQVVTALETVIKEEPPSLDAVEAAWDRLCVPAIDAILRNAWKRDQPQADEDILHLMGRLLALRPSRSMIRRAEKEISRLLEARDPALPPDAIALGPWRAFENYATAIWKDYATWWSAQLDLIGKAGGDKIWPLKHSLDSLSKLKAAPPENTIPPERSSAFRRSALEFARSNAE
jgi:hypothetical protein